ncbi:methionyl-tRNA formyltransferase [Ligilactobacillus agilis]|uniref:Methionyl-tRNA formyltransferase n=1 Tax=Ligilactobacillus agilis TaxID=1601 RepID=A0A226RE16_9LACO|nr:methionyl-tRNA formyltransferase [Ligilactobacillus agilis]OXC07807.1 methionyl-tRNA formyltransferase [Ligilactobacillus agilis]OXC08556.1 methionyl-tRNA formyltransferase [Ligilactobacillus agilis]OXC11134.1 methionyl-tRNA formyltransferase [Ligilactobacillus agilis]OXS38517.1 methionyl-tRNA formyltransferase [Ligilactobacillus agilis]OXS40176.1 methionyl-tRNA formyltransferase [Ligilactobacillus agilis]
MTSVVFMGTPAFAAPILEGLIQTNDYEVLAVVTQPDRPVGRKRILTPSPVKEVALKHGIEVLQPQKLSGSEEMQRVISLAPDLIVTAAFGQFLPTKLIAAAKVGAVNVHGSLLPKYRGGAPVQYAIMNGDQETGVTIIYMVKKMDAGDMLAQAKLPIGPHDNTGSIFAKMSILGRDTLLATLPKLVAGELVAQKQDESQVVFSPTIKPEEEKLSLTLNAKQIDWKVRALRPAPGAYFENFNGKRTKLWDVTPLAETTSLPAGAVVAVTKHELKLAAADGSVYQVNELQPAGKPRMQVTAYLNGVGQGLREGQVIIGAE